jgi:hypothetical protein
VADGHLRVTYSEPAQANIASAVVAVHVSAPTNTIVEAFDIPSGVRGTLDAFNGGVGNNLAYYIRNDAIFDRDLSVRNGTETQIVASDPTLKSLCVFPQGGGSELITIHDSNTPAQVNFTIAGVVHTDPVHIVHPLDVGVDNVGNIYILNRDATGAIFSVLKYDGTGTFVASFTVPTPATFTFSRIALGPAGAHLLGFNNANRVLIRVKADFSGLDATFNANVPALSVTAADVDVDGNGNVFIANGPKVTVLKPTGFFFFDITGFPQTTPLNSITVHNGVHLVDGQAGNWFFYKF